MQHARQFPMLAALGATLILANCGTTMGSAGTETACEAFEPVRWSQADTDETIAQVKGHNAAWQAVCGRR